jgi:hypothetical protein
LINRRAFRRFIEATDASAMQLFMVSFSASRLKIFCLCFPFLSLSFLDFLLVADADPNKEAGIELPLALGWAAPETMDEFLVWAGGGVGVSSTSSSSPNGFCSVSRRTLDLS